MKTSRHSKIQSSLDNILRHRNISVLRGKTFDEFNQDRTRVKKRFNSFQLEQDILQIKKYSIANLADLVNLTKERMEEKDIHCIYAKTSQEARRIALEIINNEDTVVQCSTDMPVEIDLDLALIRKGQSLITTEVNNRLFQLVSKGIGFHKGVPFYYFSREDWAQTIQDTIDPDVSNDPSSLAKSLNENIKIALKRSKVGITGANSISAADGAVNLTHNFGNSTLVSQRPTHLVIAGIEKIVPNLIDAWKTSYLQALYSSGLGGSTYQIMIRGPAEPVTVVGTKTQIRLSTKNLYVILLDNGRTRMVNEGFEEALYCIRCFTCHNYCPAYRVIGPGCGFDYRSPGFGYKGYIGGHGIVLSNFLFSQEEAVEAGLFECILCGACYKECPLQIDVPSMVKRLRKDVMSKDQLFK